MEQTPLTGGDILEAVAVGIVGLALLGIYLACFFHAAEKFDSAWSMRHWFHSMEWWDWVCAGVTVSPVVWAVGYLFGEWILKGFLIAMAIFVLSMLGAIGINAYKGIRDNDYE